MDKSHHQQLKSDDRYSFSVFKGKAGKGKAKAKCAKTSSPS